MRHFVILLVAVLSAVGYVNGVLEVVATHNGQPGCFIRYEFERLWRHNFDQRAYWRCERWGEGAVRHECPPHTSFQDFWQTCLPDGSWQWTPYSDPPTRPGEQEVDQCEPLENPTPCPTVPPITTPEPEWNTTTPTPPVNWNTTTTGDWNTTTPTPPVNWNTTTPENWNTTTTGDWNTTTIDWSTTTPNWNTSTTDSDWNSTTPDSGNTTRTPDFSTTSPHENESSPPPTTPTDDTDSPSCPTCPPTCPTCPPGTDTPTPPTPPDNPSPGGICPGANEDQHAAGDMNCNPPACTEEQWLNGTLYPTRDPTKFFQCGPGEGNLYVMPCGPATCFSFEEQVCVHFEDWKNSCNAGS